MAGISGGKLIQRFHCISKFDNLQSSGPFRKTLATLRMPSPVKSVSKSPAKNVQAKKFKLEDAEEAAPVLCFSKLSEAATAPTRGSKLAAGYDLYSAYDYEVPSKGKCLVKTDIQIQLPSGCYGRVAPRSGLTHKHFLDVGAGVIDEDYRGNVGVILFNFGEESYKVQRGDRVAQLICERIFYPELVELESLTETDRGHSGYGSSGKN